ncbi:hypothetical protein MRB53_042042 [Persea americana]|nr:hypothetical protein MRB53_042042 [Persea americana]
MPLLGLVSEPFFAHIQLLYMLLVSLVVTLPRLVLSIVLHPSEFLNHPHAIDNFFHQYFVIAWAYFAPLIDQWSGPFRERLLKRAKGVVLEIGPGYGQSLKYYSRVDVKRLVLVEPAAIEEPVLAAAGVTEGSVDAVVCMLVLCGVPGPQAAIEMYRRLLKKGGSMIFVEHVKSADPGTVTWQKWYNKYGWKKLMGDCDLTRETGQWIIHGARGPALKIDSAADTNGDLRSVDGRWTEYSYEKMGPPNVWSPCPNMMGYAVKA